MTMDVYGGGWIEEKLAQRHQAVRFRLMKEMHARHKAKRARRRDYARLALAVAICCLGVATVEMGRMAYQMWPSAETARTYQYSSAAR